MKHYKPFRVVLHIRGHGDGEHGGTSQKIHDDAGKFWRIAIGGRGLEPCSSTIRAVHSHTLHDEEKPMSIDLTIANPISGTLQAVQDQNNNASALSIASNMVQINGQDVVGGALPLIVQGVAVNDGDTWGRLIRLASPSGAFFDIGIDQNGNLFFNTPNSTQTAHALTISPTGVVTIGS
jgi:hypothetical protein